MNNYEVYYVCKSYFPSPLYLIPLLICSLGIYFLFNLKNPYNTKKGIFVFFGVVFTITGVFVIIISIISYATMYKNVFSEYNKGNFLIEEGEIKNLNVVSFGGKGSDEFDVNSIHFAIDGALTPGYHKRASCGGIIRSNSIRVRISYVHYQDINYIMKIEAVSDDFSKYPIVLPSS